MAHRSELIGAEQDDIPQSEPLNEDQVLNNAGGYVFEIDDFARLRRFIVLGSNANNYYVSSKELELENCECVLRLLARGHGLRVVDEVTRISRDGRAPRQSAGILVLAVCARLGDIDTRRAALAALPAVCRTASTLFEMVQRCKQLGSVTRATRPGDASADPEIVLAWLRARKPAATAAAAAGAEAGAADATGAGGRGRGRGRSLPGRGGPGRKSRSPMLADYGEGEGGGGGKASWGRSMRRAIAAWYLDKSPAAVAYQVTKYSQRQGWSHVDLIRLAHPDPEEHAAKRRKRMLAAAEKEKDRKEDKEEEKKDMESAATATDSSASDADGGCRPSETRRDAAESDSDWIVVPQGMAEGGEDVQGNGGEAESATAELGTLLAAMAVPSVAAAAGDADEMGTAVEAQRVADMKAIFDFLTHETLPGQERPVRRARRQPVAGGGGGTATEHAATAAAERALAAAEGFDVSVYAAVPADNADTSSAVNEPSAAGDLAMSAIEAADAEAAADATTAAAATPAAAPLSPVMQYLVDAHRLRKTIRAPPPVAKSQPLKRSQPPQPWRGRPRRGRVEPPKPEPAAAPVPPPDPAAIAAYESARAAAVELAVSLVRRHRFGHEHVGDTVLLRAPELWAAFLEVGMPLTALVRNLGRMTQMGVMQRPDCLNAITRRLRDGHALAAARVHPMTLLDALSTYSTGSGARGVSIWEPEPAVTEALEAGFYLAFKNVVPTGLRYLVGLDVSGSMSYLRCAGMTSLSCREAAAAMLMSLVRTEPWVKTLAFSDKLVPMEVKSDHKLQEVMSLAASIPMGGTDCALPMLYALEHRLPVDVFVILTDNETWFGDVHPAEALRRYRSTMGLPRAKLVVLAFSATRFSIADPRDGGMLDVAGLDSAVPQLVADFAAGRV